MVQVGFILSAFSIGKRVGWKQIKFLVQANHPCGKIQTMPVFPSLSFKLTSAPFSSSSLKENYFCSILRHCHPTFRRSQLFGNKFGLRLRYVKQRAKKGFFGFSFQKNYYLAEVGPGRIGPIRTFIYSTACNKLQFTTAK